MNWSKILKEHEAGKTIRALAIELGFCKQKIVRELKKVGYKSKKNNWQKLNWKNLHKEYLDGKTLIDIGKEIGCPFNVVSRNFKNRNLKVLSLSKAGLRSKRLNRGTKGRTRATIKINGKRRLLSHYNWCIANNFTHIPKGMIIHHIDNDRHNNNSKNLVLLPDTFHKSLHAKLKQIKMEA